MADLIPASSIVSRDSVSGAIEGATRRVNV